MIKLRNIKSNKLEDLANGPGKVGQCLGVDK
jgi:3-methyladenine DNA glycosylase Mpg